MKRTVILLSLVVLLMAAASCGTLQGKAGPKAAGQTVLVANADIITMNPKQPYASAMAFSGGRIVAIGSEEAVRASAGSFSKYFDLQGRTVTPGFIETHDHLYMSSTQTLMTDVTPFTTPTLASALEKIRNTDPNEEGRIVAFGADQTLYKEKRGPTRDLLDPMFPNTPVVVYHLSGHGGFANSEALRRAGVTKDTPNPQGGVFEKDASGELTGYLSGQPALLAVSDYPAPTAKSARLAAEMRARAGVTTASEFAILNGLMLEGLSSVTRDPEFPVRIVGGLFITTPGFKELAPKLRNFENDSLKLPFIKTWTDGSLQGGTGHLSEGYHDPHFGQGGARGTQEEFSAQVLEIYKLGLWPAIHANGDGAADVALNAIEYAQQQTRIKGVRSQIIHAQMTRPDQIRRMAELNAYPTFFTTHVYYWGDIHYEKTLGPVRAQRMSAMKDAFDAGIRPTMHNDPPVTPVNPIFNMWIAVNRRSQSGRVLGADQAITAEQALAAYTSNAAFQFGLEDEIGSLEVGKAADFVVLDANPLKVAPDEIRDVKVVATVYGGKLTHSDATPYDRVSYPGREK